MQAKLLPLSMMMFWSRPQPPKPNINMLYNAGVRRQSTPMLTYQYYPWLVIFKPACMSAPLALTLALVPLMLALDIDLQLPPLVPQQHPGTTLNITLRPGEVYQHKLQILAPHIAQLPQQCLYQPGYLSEAVLGTVGNHSGDGQYVYVQKYNAIYILASAHLTVYTYTEAGGKVQPSASIQAGVGGCTGRAGVSGDAEYLYYFTCTKILRVQLKASLTKVAVLHELSDPYEGFKVIPGSNFFLWASHNQVRVYVVNEDRNLSLHQTLQHWGTVAGVQKLADMAYEGDRLYILGEQKQIYVYERSGDGMFGAVVNVSTANICEKGTNQRIVVNRHNVYVYAQQQGQEYVAELELSEGRDKVHLVRYFKGHRNLLYMGMHQGGLLLAYGHVLNLYEANQDPRTIHTLMNGVSNPHFQPIAALHALTPTLFIKSTPQGSHLLRLLLHPPTLSCSFASPHPAPLLVPVPSPCPTPSPLSTHPCTSTTLLSLTAPPLPPNYHIYIILAVMGVSVGVVLVLARWRSGKLRVIEDMVEEINRIRAGRRGTREEREWVEVGAGYGVEEKEDGEEGESGSGDSSGASGRKGGTAHERREHEGGKHEELHEEVEIEEIQGTERVFSAQPHQ